MLRRTAQTTWTQDDESLSYQLNPRVKTSEMSDPQGNHTGTSVDYTSFGLPAEAWEWSGTAANVLRHKHTEYDLDPVYLSRRVIGLVSSTSIYDEAGYVASKVDYTYDQGGQFLEHQGEPVQHDGANYGVGFVIGRGLLTSVRRWDVTALHDITKSVESRVGYNTTGSAIFNRDPLGHLSSVSYADRFSDAGSTNTLAYPTIQTDPDNYSSKIEYSFDTGQVTRAEDPKGAQQTFTYDAAGRTVRVERSGKDATTNQAVSGGYTRWVYSDSIDAVQTWTQVDAGKPEVCSISVVDGAGRTRATASDFPGSNGGYRAQYTTYDIAGRVYSQSNPAEVNGLWNTVGDDAAGWNWTQQTYDWKGRPLTTTEPGGATVENSYGGCGCAGGEVVTTKGELVPIPDTSSFGRRTQNVYHDPLGREVKAEALNWDGTVYSTTTSMYNALDQVTRVRRYAGAAPSPEPQQPGSDYETTTMTYDGHGRLSTSKQPIQTNPTSYTYNADDTINTVTDARGVVATFGYNNRRMVTHAGYSQVTGVDNTGPIDRAYDAVGNQLWMTDDTGRIDYEYDSLSRLRVETRHFTGLALGNAYPINYTYTVGGRLRTVTAPSGASVTYSYDQTGRPNAITASNFGGAATLASNLQYRAWGAVKHLTYGNTVNLDYEYNSRLQVTKQSLKAPGTPAQDQVNRVNDYVYYNDGRVGTITDEYDHRYDRSYTYDHVERLTQAQTGYEARGEQTGELSPYKETFQYDALGNTTNRFTRNWSYTTGLKGQRLSNGQWVSFGAAAYVGGRREGVTYDAAGNITDDGNVYTFDAAGRQTQSRTPGNTSAVSQTYDGDGRVAKRVETQGNNLVYYQMHATGLGGALIEVLDGGGARVTDTAYGTGGEQLATTSGSGVTYFHTDPFSTSRQATGAGAVAGGRTEYDPVGAEAGEASDYEAEVPDRDFPLRGLGRISAPMNGCIIDGMSGDCETAIALVQAGGAGMSFTYDSLPARPFGYDYRTGQAGWLQWVRNPMHAEYRDGEGHFEVTSLDAFGSTTPVTVTQNPSKRRLTDAELSAIRSELEKMLANDKCRAFIDKLVSLNTGKPFDSRSLLGYFDDTAKSSDGGVFFALGDGGINRQHHEDYPQVLIGDAPPANIISSARASHLQASAQIALHEFIHAVTYGADKQLSEGLQKLGIVPIRDGKPLSPPTGQLNGKPFNDYSGYWNSALGNACFPQGMFKP